MVDSRWIDPEVDDLFKDEPELAALASQVRAARPEPALDPRFSAVLRAQLMREAPAALRGPAVGRGAAMRTRVHRPSWWQRPAPFAWGGAGLGLALVAVAAVALFNTRVQDNQVTARSAVAELHAVSPDNVITVAFSEPMNQAAVVAGLHIRPATQVSTAWQGNNLLITPTHRLAGNTPYTVTIDRGAARATNGSVAAADIHIAFGTAATPPSSPAIATLQLGALGPADGGSQLFAGPAGAVIATASNAPAAAPTPTPTPASATPSPSASGTLPSSSPSAPPSARQSPSPSASLMPTGAAALPAGGLRTVLYSGGSASPQDLGPAATSAALSPNGMRLVSAIAEGGGIKIVLTPIGSGESSVLATIGVPVLATGWLSADTALVAESDRIVGVDLQGHVSTLATLPQGTRSVVLAAQGGHAFAGSDSTDGTLVDLGGGASRALAGSRTLAAFSGDGATVAWIDSSHPAAQLVTSPVARAAVATVPLDHPGDSVIDLALDEAGTRAALVDHPSGGHDQLEVVTLPSGAVVARGAAGTHPVFLRGNRLALLTGAEVVTAALPGAATSGPVNVLPDGAAGVLQAFTEAQTDGDGGAVEALSLPAVGAAAATPHGLTRAYVISAALNADGTVSATARLIIDPSTAHPLASFADETLVLSPSTGRSAYAVSALTVGPLHDEPVGPHVVQVSPLSSSGRLVLEVGFDSDLRAGTVAAAISVSGRNGRALTVSTVYDSERRVAVVSVDASGSTPVDVTVATGVLDVDGQALASAFQAAVGG